MEEPAQGDGGGASDLQELRGRAALLSGGFTWPGRRPNTHRLDVKPDSGDRGHHLAKFELVQNGGFAGSIEADHEDAHVLLGHEARPYLAKEVSHLVQRGFVLRPRGLESCLRLNGSAVAIKMSS